MPCGPSSRTPARRCVPPIRRGCGRCHESVLRSSADAPMRRHEPGVAADSQVETFAAVRLRIESWRWQGVPFYIRTGKSLPMTSTEVVVRLRRPPTVYPTAAFLPNYFRFCIIPHQTRKVRQSDDSVSAFRTASAASR